MTPTRKREIQAYLTGRIPLEFRGEKIEPPADLEIKSWIISAPPELLHNISRGPNGDAFRTATKAALTRIVAKEMEGKPVPNGRVASAFMGFDKKEVSVGVQPIDPDKK